MAKDGTSLLEFVPDAFRREKQVISGYTFDRAELEAVYRATLPAYLKDEGLDPGDAIIYTMSAMAHLLLIDTNVNSDVRYLKGKLTEVEYLTKGDKGGEMPGKKARIHFINNDGEDEHLDTDFVEYNSKFVSAYNLWKRAMARTIAKLAEDNIGKDAVLVKHTFAIDDNIKARQIIDIHIQWKSGPKDDDDDDRGSSRRSSSRRGRKDDDDEEDGGSRRSSSRGSRGSSRSSSKDDDAEDESPRGSRRKGKKGVQDLVEDALEKYDEDDVTAGRNEKHVDGLIKLLEKESKNDDIEDLIIEYIADASDKDEDDVAELSQVDDVTEWAVHTLVLALG